MPTTEEIVQSIDSRLVRAREEIQHLESARTALRDDDSGARPARATKQARHPRRTAARPTAKTGAAERTRPAARSRSRGTRRPGTATTSEQLEETLASSTEGLSAVELVERTGVERRRGLSILRELEAAGRVHRSGERRTTRWHVTTDEQRIARRAAELAARS